MYTPPPRARARSQNVVRENVQTGAEICKNRRRKPLGENVGELHRGGNIKNPNCSKGHPFPYEVEVDFHVLGVLMLIRVGGEVDGTDVVAVVEASRG